MPKPYVIGLTGNIATGKSVVAGMLEQLGARVIDADDVAHEVIEVGTPAWQRVVDLCGEDILRADGEIDRAQLGARVFADPEKLRRLEEIVHPGVIAECQLLLEQPPDETGKGAADPNKPSVAVLEAIKLIEAGMASQCDEIWVVTSPREVQVQRLTERRGMSVEQAELRIDAQPPQADKVAVADVVIDNSGTLEQTRAQVEREWQRIVQSLVKESTGVPESAEGAPMPSWRNLIEQHPYLTMWAVMAIGFVAIFLLTSRTADLLPSQRLFMATACVAVAGLCSWIISWE
jgi:dephospho-CoA kinase